MKWNGLKYEVLRAWSPPSPKNQIWNLLIAQAGECKGKPACPLPLQEAQQKALEALDDRALSYLRVPVLDQLTEATIAGVQADPHGKIVSAAVRVTNRSPWPITGFSVRVRWQAQTKTDAVVKASGQPFTKVGWSDFARSVDLKGTIAPGKQVTLTSDPKETGPRGRDDGRGPLATSQGVELNRYAPTMEIIAVRFTPEGLAPAKP